MKNLTFLLYILAKSVSNIRPVLVEALQNWPAITPNLDLGKIDPREFCTAINLNPEQTRKFIINFTTESQESYFSLLEEHGIQTTNIFALSYPSQLLQIPDPPLVLYYRGSNIKLLESTSLAIVGSRRASSYGKIVVNKIMSEISGTNLTIISGLAYGIDAISHHAAIKNNLSTIAVLGGGLDDASIYPKNNYSLAKEILQNGGLIVSEYPPLSPALKHQFIARNRIIAGLSQGTIVVEAAISSGALLTADFAMDYNRSVYAIPGQIFSLQSQGTNNLIKQGAQMLTSIEDLLLDFDISPQTTAATKNYQFSSHQLAVLKCMQSGQPMDVEEIIEKSRLSTAEVLSTISELTLRNIITQISVQTYQKIK